MNVLKQLQNSGNSPSPMNNNFFGMLQQFSDFKKSLAGKDPNQMLNQLMTSGKYTQEQLQQARQMAEQFSGLLH